MTAQSPDQNLNSPPGVQHDTQSASPHVPTTVAAASSATRASGVQGRVESVLSHADLVTARANVEIANDEIPSLQTEVNGVKIRVASSAGVCFGVERALNLSEKALKEVHGPISSMGPLIHNPQTVSELSNRGLKVAESIESIEGTVVFRSHGVPIDLQKKAQAQGLKIVDATCPLVKVPQNFARKLSQNGYFVVIVGDKDHPEVKGVRSYVETNEAAVIKSAAEVGALPERSKVGVICQTTLKKATFLEVVEACQKRFAEVKVHNTICSATKDRQDAAFQLAASSECVVVIGGRNSSNTQKLYDICKEKSGKAYLIETEDEIKPEWFTGLKSIGITAGASTPHALIARVRQQITQSVS